ITPSKFTTAILLPASPSSSTWEIGAPESEKSSNISCQSLAHSDVINDVPRPSITSAIAETKAIILFMKDPPIFKSPFYDNIFLNTFRLTAGNFYLQITVAILSFLTRHKIRCEDLYLNDSHA